MQLLNKALLAVFILTLSSGCQLIRIDRASFTPSTPLVYSPKAEFVFTPGDRETFQLKEMPLSQQQQGYTRFCANTYRKVCRNKLPYARYAGMRGYFDSEEPVKSDGQSYEYYPVILENGEKYFFLSFKSDGGKYADQASIQSLSFNRDFPAEPFIEGATTNIIGKYNSFDQSYFLLSNGRVLQSNQLDYIRDISKKSTHRTEAADLLLGTVIEYNEDFNSYLIQPSASETAGNQGDVRLILGINQDSSWLRFKVSHLSDSLQTIKGFTLSADELKWRSPVLRFETAIEAKKVKEFFEIQANHHELLFASAVAKSDRAKLQLHTDSQPIEQELNSSQKVQLQNMLRLSELLNVEQSVAVNGY